MPEDTTTLISFDLEHRAERTIDAVFSVNIAGERMTCTVPVPIDADLALSDMERMARAEMAERLRAMADALQAKNTQAEPGKAARE